MHQETGSEINGGFLTGLSKALISLPSSLGGPMVWMMTTLGKRLLGIGTTVG
jgi:hypothetical protein